MMAASSSSAWSLSRSIPGKAPRRAVPIGGVAGKPISGLTIPPSTCQLLTLRVPPEIDFMRVSNDAETR